MNARRMAILIVAGLIAGAAAHFAAPQIVRGLHDFKTFLELQSLLNRCDAGYCPPHPHAEN